MNSPDTYASVATTHRVPLGSLFADRVDFPTALDRIVARVRSGHGGYVVTPNVDHVCVAKKNEAFQRAHTNAFLSLVDGTPLTWLAKACGKPLPQKISGSDLIRPLSARAAHEGFRIAMFGASPEALAGTKQVLLAENPDLQIVSQEHPRYTPLPRTSEVDAELHEALSRLEASQPDIVFVAMGTPNQELFLAEFEDRLAPAVLCGIGAGFDFLAGLKRRAPRWAQRLGVEWLIRLLQEPGRMWRRYLVRDAAIYGIALRQIARYRFGRADRPATPTPQRVATVGNSPTSGRFLPVGTQTRSGQPGRPVISGAPSPQASPPASRVAAPLTAPALVPPLVASSLALIASPHAMDSLRERYVARASTAPVTGRLGGQIRGRARRSGASQAVVEPVVQPVVQPVVEHCHRVIADIAPADEVIVERSVERAPASQPSVQPVVRPDLPAVTVADSPIDAPTGLVASDTRQAAKQGATLGTSLLFTSTLGVLVSLFFVPRLVGERGVGILGFGEGLATVALVVAGLGMDTYIRKEVAVRRDHASGFLFSVILARLALSIVITGAALGVLLLRQHDLRPGEDPSADGAFRTTLVVLLLYFVAQFFQQTAETFAAMLQAIGDVKRQSKLAIYSKSVWAMVVVLGLSFEVGLWIVPAALILTESAKAVVFGITAHRVFDFTPRINFKLVWPVVLAALPFLVQAMSVKVIAWVDVVLIRFLTGDDAETGYYTQALRISMLALLLAPLVQWVVLPMASRAAERSRSEFAELTKRSYQWVVCAGVPLSVLLALNADLLMSLLPAQYSPAVPALRILSALIALSYLSMLSATLLTADGRSWRVVRITFLTICLDVILNLYLIRKGWQWWGVGEGGTRAGGAGVAAAISLVAAEAAGVTWYLFELRKVVRRLSDRTSQRMIASTLLVCAGVIAADRLIADAVGVARPLIDALLMVLGLIALRVIHPSLLAMGLDRVRSRGSRDQVPDLERDSGGVRGNDGQDSGASSMHRPDPESVIGRAQQVVLEREAADTVLVNDIAPAHSTPAPGAPRQLVHRRERT